MQSDSGNTQAHKSESLPTTVVILSIAYFSTGESQSLPYTTTCSSCLFLNPRLPLVGVKAAAVLFRWPYQESKVNVSGTIYGEYTVLPDQQPRKVRPAAAPTFHSEKYNGDFPEMAAF